jgi:3-oxoacyl-[acyl-carrier-protein] synthase-3
MAASTFRGDALTLYLHGVGHAHPDNEITNGFLESLDIGTTHEWIMERVGIESRRTALPLDYLRETRNRDPRLALQVAEYSNARLGKLAVEMAAERAGVPLSKVGMLIGGSCAPDTVSPAEACNVGRELGLELPCIDVNSACTSFFAGVKLLSMMSSEELPDYVALVATDAMTRTVDYSDRNAAVLWGDAAAAALFSTRVPSRARVLGASLWGSPAGADKVRIPRLGHFEQEGRQVQLFAIKKTTECLRDLQARYASDHRNLHFIGHQANLRVLENVCKRCDISPELHHYNVDRYGNTGAAGAASVLSMSWDGFTAEDDVALVGVGSGLTWSSYLLRFDGPAGSRARCVE